MFATLHRNEPGLRPHLSVIALAEKLVDPLAFVGSLVLVEAWHGVVGEAPYRALEVIVLLLSLQAPMHVDQGLPTLYRGSWTKAFALFSVLCGLGLLTGQLDRYAPDVLLTWFLLGPAAGAVVRHGAHELIPRVINGTHYRQKVVIVGAGPTGDAIATRMGASRREGKQLLGFFDDRHAERLASPRLRLLGRIADLADYVRQQGVDVIYIALPMTTQPRIVRLLDDLRDTTVSVYFVPDLFVTDLIQARVDHVGGMPVVAVCETPFTGLNGVLKQSFDFLMAACILILIAPLMLVIAAAVKCSSPGPALFRQYRYGLDGERILVYKFRSMTVCENGETIAQARQNDARVTPLGAFLRKTSLDELPQFINVLQGRMSIVGPRPHAVAHNEMYRKLIKGYMIRHKVKPGITGWAQVNGCRGETETLEKMKQRVDFDLEYLRRWSLALDLRIILRTVRLIRKDPNAY